MIDDFEFVRHFVQSHNTVSEAMPSLIDYCETKWESDLWLYLRRLNINNDVLYLRRWTDKLLTREPPSKQIRALYFGLFNPILDNGRASCVLHVSGSTTFHDDPILHDWTCFAPDSYVPKRRYAKSRVLHEIYSHLEDSNVASVGEYVLCLGYAGLAIKEIKKSASRLKEIGIPIAVGFDSGDAIILDGE